MTETEKEITEHTCCLCLSDEESSFHSDSVLKSLPLRDMVDYCIGIQLLNIADDDQEISTSVCNECVLNVSNFYTFKKKIMRAQTILGCSQLANQEQDFSSASKTEKTGAGIVLTDDDEEIKTGENCELHRTVDDGDELVQEVLDEEHLRTPVDDEFEEEIVAEPSNNENKAKRARPSESIVSSKKPKVSVNSGERVTIQMNECLICPAILGDILQLDNHISSHKEIKCKICRRIFARYSNLKRHFMSTHSKPKPFQCDLCGLGFSFSVNLQAHAALHYSGKLRMK